MNRFHHWRHPEIVSAPVLWQTKRKCGLLLRHFFIRVIVHFTSFPEAANLPPLQQLNETPQFVPFMNPIVEVRHGTAVKERSRLWFRVRSRLAMSIERRNRKPLSPFDYRYLVRQVLRVIDGLSPTSRNTVFISPMRRCRYCFRFDCWHLLTGLSVVTHLEMWENRCSRQRTGGRWQRSKRSTGSGGTVVSHQFFTNEKCWSIGTHRGLVTDGARSGPQVVEVRSFHISSSLLRSVEVLVRSEDWWLMATLEVVHK